MTNNTMREALLKFGDENPALDLDFRLHTHGKYLTQEKAIVASRAFKAGAAWQAAQSVPVEVFDSRCNYAAFAGRVCNKCGRIHDGGLGGMVGGEQSVPKANQATQERQP